MTYVIALSFCDEDSESAELMFECFIKMKVSCYFYKRAPRVDRLMLDLHESIYTSALARVYLIKNASFQRLYTRFELTCGRGRRNNFILKEGGLFNEIIPEEFQFIGERGWTVIPRPIGYETYEGVANQVFSAIRGLEE
jgi:hypothetical protein